MILYAAEYVLMWLNTSIKQHNILYLKKYNSIYISTLMYTFWEVGELWTFSTLFVTQDPMFSVAPSTDISCSLLYPMPLLPVHPKDYISIALSSLCPSPQSGWICPAQPWIMPAIKPLRMLSNIFHSLCP